MQASSSQQQISADSADKVNYRQKGKVIDGKICKGFIQEAASKTSVGSIPAKFETIIYKTDNKKAFLSSTSRFFTADSNARDNPGPGNYISAEPKVESHIQNQESLSKKGYGNGFVSTCQRDTFTAKYRNQGPCVGQYDLAKGE